MSKQPFLIFPWQKPFLPELVNLVQSMSGDKPENATIIVPNQRPWRYIMKIFQDQKRCVLLPKIMPFSELAALWREPAASKRRIVTNPLDQVALLHKCITELKSNDSALESHLTNMDIASFFPWGLRLASLLEELFIQGKEPANLAHLDGEVAPPAAALLGALGRISHAWRELLYEKNFTTPGLEQFLAAQAAQKDSSIPQQLTPGEDRLVFIAGFSTLNGTDDVLLRTLWKAGAHICLHTDPALLKNEAPHWACSEQQSWIRRWKAQARAAIELSKEEEELEPQRKFFAGYDLHSQLEALAEDLKPDGNVSTAVVLTNSSLLMPVLHHLPKTDVNISMGYPLKRAPLFQLLDALFRLDEGRTEDGRYYWRSLLHVLQHPCLNMLEDRNETGESFHLRQGLRQMEELVRNGNRYADLEVCLSECQQKLPIPLGELLKKCLEKTITELATARTTEKLAEWLDGINGLFQEYGENMIKNFPLDQEVLLRLNEAIAPQLRQNGLSEAVFPPLMLHDIARQLLEHERIPFSREHKPPNELSLEDIQVLGMLETRLLHFDRVFIVDATDDALPGNPMQEPLLPDALRTVLGLPDIRSRERVAAYTLHRLCASAKETYFYWQEGVTRSGLFDDKKIRSRFVEELLWDVEQKKGKLLSPGISPLRTSICELGQIPRKPISLLRTPELHAAMTDFLKKPLSASKLDTYLQCPLRFVWGNLCQLKPQQEVNEGDDPSVVGICLHKVLCAMFSPYIGKKVSPGDITEAQVAAYLKEAFEEEDIWRRLPADSCLMLKAAAPFRLREFLQHQPEETQILALEQTISASLSLAGRPYDFTGIIDRIDRRDGLIHVLDYKTGAIKNPDHTLWTDEIFFAEARSICELLDNSNAGTSADEETLSRLEAGFEALRERLPSVQLPVYVALMESQYPDQVGNASLVELHFKGEEHPIFSELEDEELPEARNACNLALALLLRHMEHVPRFEAHQGDHCRYCPFSSLCAS